MHVTFVPKNFNVTHFTSLQNKITSHMSCQFTPHHFTHLQSIYHTIKNHQPTLRKISEERRSPLHRGRKPENTRCPSATLLHKFHMDCTGNEPSIPL